MLHLNQEYAIEHLNKFQHFQMHFSFSFYFIFLCAYQFLFYARNPMVMFKQQYLIDNETSNWNATVLREHMTDSTKCYSNNKSVLSTNT